MKKLFTLFVITGILTSVFVKGTYADVTKTVGATGGADFTTLKLAFDAINANTGGVYTDAITLQIIDGTTETASAVLNSSANWSSLIIYPTVTGKTISGSFAAPLIDLNGADNVTIDGRLYTAGVPGSSVDLTITNTSLSGATNTSTIRFYNDAKSNTVKYCNIKGSETSATYGVIFFSTALAATGVGNDGNIIEYNNITSDGAGRPINAVFSSGTSGRTNSGCIIRNNNIYNFLKHGTASNGIFLSTYTTDFEISGNSFYETASFAPSASVDYYVIRINNSSTGNNFTVSGNYIGGQSETCGGSAWTKTNAGNNTFYGIYLSAGVTTASNVQGNTIKNVSWSNSGAASWFGIYINSGTVNVGTTTPNNVGDATTTGSITFTSGATGGVLFGIDILNSSGTVQCTNNVIGSITTSNAVADNATNFYGISKINGGNCIINGNTIGSTSVSNSIYLSSEATGATTSQILWGIFVNTASGTQTVSNNTLANLNNGTTNTCATDFNGQVVGITSDGASATSISGNTIYNLLISSNNPDLTTGAGNIGIRIKGGGAISGNTIYGLSSDYASSTVKVIGICSEAIAECSVSGNFIHSFSYSDPSTTAGIYGIRFSAAATTFSNNIISFSNTEDVAIFGVFEEMINGNACNLYFNTVYIGGTNAGTTNSYGFYSNSTEASGGTFSNNIFYNSHSSGGFNYAILYMSDASMFIVDHNDYIASGTGAVLASVAGADYITLGDLQVATTQDASSFNSDPTFINGGSTVGADYLPTVVISGDASSTGITTDFRNVSRLSVTEVGALELTRVWKGGTSTDWNVAGNWIPAYVPAADDNITFDPDPDRHCLLDQNRSVTDITNAQSTDRMVTNGFKLTIKGSLYFTNGATIDASATGSTLEFAGASAQSIPSGSLYNNEVYDLNVNNSNNLVLNGTLRLLHTLTAASGKLDAYTNSPTVVYAGSAAQTIEANTYLGEHTKDMTISNSSGVTLNTNFSVAGLNISTGALTVIATKGLKATSGTILNSPSCLVLKSDATGNSSFIDNGTISYTNSGSAKVELYLTTCVGSTETSCYHYVSSPITNAVTGVFLNDYMRWYNTLGPNWSTEYTQTNYPLSVMKGWAVSEQGSVATPTHDNHYFIGTLNTEVGAKALSLSGATTVGWNLVGNPYPSAIDFDLVPAWTNVAKFVWYLNKSTGNYMVYPVNGLGATGSRFIPSMQGVFVYATGTSPSIIFPNSARVHDNSVPYYKEYQTSNDLDVMYLKAQGNGKESYDMASIVFRDFATGNYDTYDAQKLYGDAQAPQLFTLSSDNASLTINSLPFAGRNTTIPVNFTVPENGTGAYSLTASKLENFHPSTTITLEDKKESKMHDLKANPVYSFDYTHGDDPARFLLHFYNSSYAVNDLDGQNEMKIYSNGNTVYVKDFTGHPVTGDLYMYNMVGQEVMHQQVAAIAINNFNVSLPGGYYIVRVITKDKTFNSKIYLN
jgi:hypothetical protein